MTALSAVKPVGKSWADYYKWVGDQVDADTFPPGDMNAPRFGLWDALFDRNRYGSDNQNGPYNTGDIFDFRSPENLHVCLAADDDELNSEIVDPVALEQARAIRVALPLLTRILGTRRNKRRVSRLLENSPEGNRAVQDYITHKLYPAQGRYAGLNPDEKLVVDGLIVSGIKN